MRKFIILFIAGIFLVTCTSKSDKVERIWEEGIEVIINHLEPYKIKGEPSNLTLEEEFRIDSDRDEIVEIGLTWLMGFDVDNVGNIYVVNTQRQEYQIYKFDQSGNFQLCFGRRGQGPGELQVPNLSKVTNKNEIVITAKTNHKLIFYNEFGTLLREIPFNTPAMFV